MDFNISEIQTEILNNSTTSSSGAWTSLTFLKLTLFTPIILLAIVGNFIALFAFISRHHQMKSPTHFFIANLALADFLVGILCLPFLATYSLTGTWYFGRNWCEAYMIMHFWFCSCSIYSTCAICVERYVGVRYPLSHTKIMSTPRVIMIILLIWGYGGAVTFISLYAWPSSDLEEFRDLHECKGNNEVGHAIFSTLFILYIPVLIMVILYWRIYVIATKQLRILRGSMSKIRIMRKNKKQKNSTKELIRDSATLDLEISSSVGTTGVTLDLDEQPEVEEPEDSGNSNSPGSRASSSVSWFPSMKRVNLPLSQAIRTDSEERGGGDTDGEIYIKATTSRKHINLAKRLVILVGLLILSYVPYYTVFLIRAVDPALASSEFFAILKWMRYGNSAVNPFLYAFAVPAYRKAFVNIVVKRKICC